MKKSAILFFFLITAQIFYSQEKEWTLEECVSHALENNISVKQSELDLENASIDKLEAVGNFMPTLMRMQLVPEILD